MGNKAHFHSSGGYPGPYNTGEEIFGLEEAGKVDETVVFHAGTAVKEGKTYERKAENGSGANSVGCRLHHGGVRFRVSGLSGEEAFRQRQALVRGRRSRAVPLELKPET